MQSHSSSGVWSNNKEFLMVGDHAVRIPKPAKKSDILFVNESKNNAYWNREKLLKTYKRIWHDFIPGVTKMWQPASMYNNDGLLASLNEDDSNYIDQTYIQERDRRLNGVFFKNCEDITWITGDHYFFLMWARMQRHDGMGLYADYREFQRDYAYLIHHCNTSPNILGLFCSKPKKTGITNFHWSGYYLNKSTLYKNKNLGYMNIDQGQAAKTFRDYYLFAYNGLVSPLKPTWRNKSETEGTIILGESYSSSKKIKAPNSDGEDDLNTSVMCVATKPKAFDVAVMSDITFDEPTKYKESFGEIWRTNKEAVKIQSKINGRAWLFNYTPEDDNDSFVECKEVFEDSELSTIKPESKGQTKSGLINYHIPAYMAWEGAFDKYGRCNEKQAAKEIDQEREKVKGSKKAYQSILRQYANTKREAWGSGGFSTVFNTAHLADCKYFIEKQIKSDPLPQWIEGNLKWKEPLWNIGKQNTRPAGVFCEVYFEPTTDSDRIEGKVGKWRLRREPYIQPQDLNIPIRLGRDEQGNLLAPDRFKFIGGMDTVQYADAKDLEDASLQASYTMNLYDPRMDTMWSRPVSKIIMSEYLFRPDLAEEAVQDMIKEVIYFGKLVAVEGNAPTVFTRLINEGLGNYVIVKHKDGHFTRWSRLLEDNEYNSIRTTANQHQTEFLDMMIELCKHYIYKAEEVGDIDYAKYLTLTLLDQLMNFKKDNTRKFDAVMAFFYTLLALHTYMAELNKPNEDIYAETTIRAMFSALER